MDPTGRADRGAPAPDAPPAPRRCDPRPARRVRRWVRATLVVAGLVLGATACVGKTGRNDDYVAPGSGEGPSGNVVPHDGG